MRVLKQELPETLIPNPISLIPNPLPLITTPYSLFPELQIQDH